MKINPEISIRKVDEEIFIYDRNKSFIHMFNSTGAFLWNALEHNHPEDQIIEEICRYYNVSPEIARQDLKEFIRKLSELGLIDSE